MSYFAFYYTVRDVPSVTGVADVVIDVSAVTDVSNESAVTDGTDVIDIADETDVSGLGYAWEIDDRRNRLLPLYPTCPIYATYPRYRQ